MKILTFGRTDLVSNAIASTFDIGLHLLVNTNDRWLDFKYKGASLSYMSTNDYDPKNDNHTSFTVFPEGYLETDEDSTSEGYCELVLVAENEIERKLIKGQNFSSQEKDQIYIVFIQPDRFSSLSQIAEMK